MRLGSQAIIVVSVDENPSVRDENGQPALVRTETTVRGVRIRPMPATEVRTDNGDRVTDPWRLTAPPVDAITGLGPQDEIRYDGDTFSVVGLPRTFTDLAGRSHKTTVLLQRNLG